MQTNKWIITIPGSGGTSLTSVSQIDFKYYTSGIGTNVFAPSQNDLRSTIYNWADNNEPVIQFGGVGTVGAQQYFVGPYTDFSGGFTGISSTPSIKIYPISGRLYSTNIYLSGGLYDSSISSGQSGNLLSSIGTGVLWKSYSLIQGSISTGQIAYGVGNSTLTGSNNLWFNGVNLGIGTSSPVNTLQVNSGNNVSVFSVGTGAGNYGFIGVNTNSTTAIGPESLAIHQSSNSPSFTLMTANGNVNNYLQQILINGSSGNNASADLVVQANTGNEYAYYIDMGINNSGYTQTGLYGNALDAYFYSTGNNLIIANASIGSSIVFSTGTSFFYNQPLVVMTSGPSPSGLGGSVGFNTMYPTQLMHVHGNSRFTGAIYDSSNTPGNPIGVVTQFLASTGAGITWSPVKRPLIATLLTAYTPSGIGTYPGMYIVPQDPNDGVSSVIFNFKRINVRVETPSIGISTVTVVKYIGFGSALGLQTSVLSSPITISGSNSYEGFSTSFALGFTTCASSDKLSVQWVGLSTFHTNWTVECIMNSQS